MRNRMTITNTANEFFFNSPSIVIQNTYSAPTSREVGSSFYLITEVPACSFTSISAVSPFGYHQYSFAPQHIIISLANEMFKGSKPMVGEELEILNKTYNRLLKKRITAF